MLVSGSIVFLLLIQDMAAMMSSMKRTPRLIPTKPRLLPVPCRACSTGMLSLSTSLLVASMPDAILAKLYCMGGAMGMLSSLSGLVYSWHRWGRGSLCACVLSHHLHRETRLSEWSSGFLEVWIEVLGTVVMCILITVEDTIPLHTFKLIFKSHGSNPTDLSCCCFTSLLQILREYPARLRSGLSFQLIQLIPIGNSWKAN